MDATILVLALGLGGMLGWCARTRRRAATIVLGAVLAGCASDPRAATPAFANDPGESREEDPDDEDPLGGLPRAAPAPADPAPPEAAGPPAPVELRGIVVALSADRRAAVVLDAEGRATLVTRDGGARHSGIAPGATVSVLGDPQPRDVIVARTIAVEDAPFWEGLPQVHELDEVELADPLLRTSDWVLVPDVLAIDASTVVSRREPGVPFRVRAPRGAITARAEYHALRGVLVDITSIEPHGGVVLWIARPEDVIRN